jgi:hypothetical protein
MSAPTAGADPPGDPGAALDKLADAFERAVRVISRQTDPQEAFDAATRLADAMREAGETAADLRAQTAVRIWEEEKVSLAGLAERIGVSKARAGQLVQSARRAQQGSEATKTRGER